MYSSSGRPWPAFHRYENEMKNKIIVMLYIIIVFIVGGTEKIH